MANPERRCIGCGRRSPQSDLLRLAVDRTADPPRVVVVGTQNPGGRGAYLCRRVVCLDEALRRKAFQRAFRMQVVVVQDELSAAIMGEPRQEFEGG